jgi:hypothetical protein
MKKNIMGITLLLLSNLSLADSYSKVSEIKSLTLSGEVVRIKLNSMTAVPECSGIKNDWYSLSLNDTYAKEYYSALLTAKSTKEKIFFRLSGCFNNYAKIQTVYLCDNDQCS